MPCSGVAIEHWEHGWVLEYMSLNQPVDALVMGPRLVGGVGLEASQEADANQWRDLFFESRKNFC
jgi:hypothetical protein